MTPIYMSFEISIHHHFYGAVSRQPNQPEVAAPEERSNSQPNKSLKPFHIFTAAKLQAFTATPSTFTSNQLGASPYPMK
jgi:hypothetical protein